MPQNIPTADHASLTLNSSQLRFADIRSAIRDAIAQLEVANTPSASLAAELLLMHVLIRDRAYMYAHPEQELDAATRAIFFSLVAQRASGVPTQHLTGHQEFWGLDFEVTPDVLIPRPETENLIEVALDRLGVRAGEDSQLRHAPLRIADVGTGSGCIAIALAKELTGAQIIATDISAAALEIARRNAARHEVSRRIKFVECNLLDGLLDESPLIAQGGPQGKPATLRLRSGQANHPSSREAGLRANQSTTFDMIASNPPYIGREEAATLAREVREHEPELALFGGESGTELYAPLIAQSARLLKPDGILVLELGHNSATYVSRLLETKEWYGFKITKDLAGIARIASTLRK